MQNFRRASKKLRMDTSIVTNSSSGQHPYLGQQALTRPDWPTKHEEGSKARNLLPYILDPQKHSKPILRVSPDSILIEDKFPKAHVHLLVLPTWLPHRDYHPHDAFEDPSFLAMVRGEVEEGLKIAIPRLRKAMHQSLKKSGVASHTSRALLDKRDFSKDFHVGIHAHPSQHELHIHIISRDMVSWHDYDAPHYRAFNTPFLVPIQKYPLPMDSKIREVDYQNNNLRKGGFACWRCGQKYSYDDYYDLKSHLREEWHSWIREGLDTLTPNGMASTVNDMQSGMQSLEIAETESTKI